MSSIMPNLEQPPPVKLTFSWTPQQLEHVWRSIMDYNGRRLQAGDSPLAPNHPLFRIQTEIQNSLEPMILEGVKNGWDVSILMRMKTEINEVIEELRQRQGEDEVVSE